MSPTRLETFADGVFAIAATLLILNVDGAKGSVTSIWPAYVAYAVSFLTIGIIWVNHHTVMNQFDRVDRRFLFLNILLLMCVAFVPFPTRLIAEHVRGDGLEGPALVYGATMTVMSIAYLSLWLYGVRRLLRADADPRTIRGITRSYLPGTWIYLGSTLVAFVSPLASVVGFGLIALFYVVESSLFGGRSPSSTIAG
ncbi:MAG TPA: TMEM175 family protein [Gaiellaceae bacterium]|nr:TMEM175 family protein [Gaiellaceae bacterium]